MKEHSELFTEIIIHPLKIFLKSRVLLACTAYKSSTLMSGLFRKKERKCNLRNDNALVSNIPHSTKYGLNAIYHLAPKFWEIIPNEIKSCKPLNSFKAKINMWVPINYRCNLCRP